MKSHFLFTFLLFINVLHSQNRSFGTLPILQPDIPPVENPEDLNHTQDYKDILKVYEALVTAKGDFRQPVPKLFLRDEVGYVASIDYEKSEITIEKTAYEACKPFGPVGVATLLGHELIHYYEKHAWKNAFAEELSALKVAKDLKKVQDHLMNETQADYLGGFLAYTAGYGLNQRGDSILRALYTAYKRDEDIPGYPSLSDRIAMTNKISTKIQRLVDVFEMGNLMASVGKYAEAYMYYKYILNEYQSRELYNNLGTMAVLNAMPLMDQDSLVFKYVTELDLKFSSSRDISNKIDSILRQSIHHFDAAISLDPNYAPAYLNKANAYALLNELDKASFYLKYEALPRAEAQLDKYSKTKSDILVLQGIIAARNKDTSLAKQLFSTAITMNNSLAQENLDILEHKITVKKSGTAGFTMEQESIDSISIDQYTKGIVLSPGGAKLKYAKDDDKTVDLEEGNVFFQWKPSDKNFKIFFNHNENDKKRNIFLIANKNYLGKTIDKIGIGDCIPSMVTTYGDPQQLIETVQGRLYVYPNYIFVINAEGKIEQWMHFKTKQVLF